MRKLVLFFKDGFLLKKLAAVVVGLIIFRALASIPIPSIDATAVSGLLLQNQLLGVFNIFSGGGLSNFSIAMLGVFPYITVSIVFQLLTIAFPPLYSMYNEEGEIGRKKFGQWIRIFTVPVTIINSIGILLYFSSQNIIPVLDPQTFITTVVIVTAGSILTMWVGELITEFGIGNGISFIVFAGIIVNLPTLSNQALLTYSQALLPLYILGGFAALLFVAVTIWINEADRPVPVTYAREGVRYGSSERRAETYIPVKVNPVGVLSIIFSLTVVAFFAFVFRFASASSVPFVKIIGDSTSEFLANGYYYAIPVAFLTIFFTYFHAPIVFNTKKMATNLQKQGAFVPGLRPGEETSVYFNKVLKHILFYAVAFLTLVAVVPYLVTGSVSGTFLFAIGGTGLMIIVSVVLDVYRKINSRLSSLL